MFSLCLSFLGESHILPLTLCIIDAFWVDHLFLFECWEKKFPIGFFIPLFDSISAIQLCSLYMCSKRISQNIVVITWIPFIQFFRLSWLKFVLCITHSIIPFASPKIWILSILIHFATIRTLQTAKNFALLFDPLPLSHQKWSRLLEMTTPQPQSLSLHAPSKNRTR